MSAFHHPSPGFPPGFLFDVLCFFASRSDMRGISELVKNIANLVIIVSLIETDALRVIPCRPWMFNRNTLDRLFRHFEVVAISSINGKTNRYSVSISKQTAF